MLTEKKTLGKISILEKTYEQLRFASVAPVAMEMAQTCKHFRTVPGVNADFTWQSVTNGDRWGDNWINAWFRGSIVMPEVFQGQAAFIRAKSGAPESQLFIDGEHRGVFDANHPVRLLSMNPIPGRTVEIALEAYAGHTIPGTQPFEQVLDVQGGASQDARIVVTKNCRRFESVELVSDRADVSSFVFALRTLRQLAEAQDEHSLRRGRIQAALQQVYACVYAKPEERSEADWRGQLAVAQEIMAPLLALKNGSTAPTFGIIGHSHIDTAWLWTLAETTRKLARTFSSVLSLMDQYPEFRFTQSAAYHSEVVRSEYPKLYERIKQRVQEGRWEINGAMWIEPDCNIPSGEALVRQCLLGQQSTREMFGVTTDTLWQPDVFGYSGALPQILQGCDVQYFCTTKLGWNDTNKFPYDTFEWQGIDGTSVLAHFNRIHCIPDPETLINAWHQVQHKDVQDRRLITFGYGDGGGGPTAEMIEMGRLAADLEGCPCAEYASVTEFMTGVKNDLTSLPVWKGELYLELHRGTLTSIASIKRYNRLCEFALRDAEFDATLACLLKGVAYPAEALRDLWKRFLVNQFHDILPGSSIAEVNDEALASMSQCFSEAIAISDEHRQALAGPALGTESLLIANDLSWPRSGELEVTGLGAGYQVAAPSFAQEIEDVEGTKRLVLAGIDLPAMGFSLVPLSSYKPISESPFHVDGETIETPFAQVKLDASGQILSFYDKAARRELVTLNGSFNQFCLSEDVPAAWDNWDIDRDQRLKPCSHGEMIRREIVADGPLQLRIRQEYRIGLQSTLTQDIVFHANTARVDFDTVVEWHEKYQLLKTSFSLNVLADTARHEIQFGHVTRSTHENTSYDRAQFDICAHKWTDISETDYGVAFLNDCKYACTVKNETYELTLIKSGRHPDARGDEGRHRFAYALLPHQGGFSVESVVRPAYEFNSRVSTSLVSRGDTNAFSLVTLDTPNVIIEAVKWAEDGEAFVLRLYEASKTGTHVKLKFGVPIQSVSETNLLEEKPQALDTQEDTVSVYLRPFEIKTLRCVPDRRPISRH